MSRRSTLLALVAVLVAVVLSACKVESTVAVQVEPDGSGTVVVAVRLDRDAAGRLGDPSTALRWDDLTQAGWDVATPEAAEDGGLLLRAERPFASPADLPAVLDEVGGADGVFRDVELSLDDGFASTAYDFHSGVELSGSPEQFGDEAMTALLEGLPLARTPEELALEGAADPDAMTLEVRVELPGGEPETNGEVRDGAAVWTFPVSGGEASSATLTASSSTGSTATRVLIGVGVLALLAAVGLAAIGFLRRR